ncbi:MAG TPA: DNA-3-methyladenine glycosylase 2 family protein [Patescibacteria group bacterium]|nr:DNA-3-methyladenine glycosylase 2 family protein [Patescibacteria group bacterium]
MKYIHELPSVREGLDHLVVKDPFFKKSKIDIQNFVWPYMGPGLPGLVRIVIGQQVSTAAAATMWARFQEKVPQVTPQAILKLTPEDMKALGLSRQKSAYISGLAQAVAAKTFDFDKLTQLEDDAISEAITAVKGLGPWSAQMYLMFALGRPDVWPAGDLGIQEGLRIYLGRDERPGVMETLLEGKRFAPHRTAASLLLWHTKAGSKN